MNELGKISQNSVASGQVSMIEIDENSAGQRIDNFLLRVCKGVPKSHIYRILRSGEVRVNKGRVDAQYRLALGDLVRVPPVRVAAADLARAETPIVPPAQFDVLYEDDAMLVINKPAGVAVHGGSGVAFGVIEQMRQARPRAKFLELVHRLDRETSGILMLAKKRTALVGLHEQIRENRMDKRYFACGHGQWQPDWGRRRVVKAPLFKYSTAEGERRVRVQDDGLPSHTVFNLIERWPDYALVEAELKTGRTHQIRVHLAHLGLPIAGDAKYGDFALNKALARANAQPSLKRMFLHAYRLKLAHPLSGEPLQFDAPLPDECRRFLDQLSALRDTA
ncbi:RluA family pseudouridine synthase [Burkholderia vietnamiensis]|uniref:Pseudouridine synthase n=2 Tax=Burkholderia vietnamiensis TaxID=60552 RepID=A4JCN9_BURVG|nr:MULTISPECIES: RluA family pseudouridine synthase [Burkholderia]ABO54042.1 pseudouridine synthase, RluA family [Burkholderia vietnamiensis G4]AOJ99714.1 RNA pseudouridine synthase [Burkholderia vietnamiensis]AOK09628.1 RNA pseudouridine synthase [Burkholderia vietnamiensis]KVF08783.1 RNA pseudouridine synthase [Burkholderia vietnamiensis]KVF61664.1 RNA pseudouridine synthase [Burkholderia vietnamiensis]